MPLATPPIVLTPLTANPSALLGWAVIGGIVLFFAGDAFRAGSELAAQVTQAALVIGVLYLLALWLSRR